MNAILIVTYNTDFFLKAQLEQINRLCEDEVDIFIIDNTPAANSETKESLQYISQTHNAQYFHLGYSHPIGSFAHAGALNQGVDMLQHNGYTRVCTLDHDIIPFKKFNLGLNYTLKGLKQERGNITYMHPGFLSRDLIKTPPLDLSPSLIRGEQLDTGGATALVIENTPPEEIQFISQEHRFNNTNKFHEILDECLFHFIRGSNWGIPESPALSTEENNIKLKNLSEEFNNLAKGYTLQCT